MPNEISQSRISPEDRKNTKNVFLPRQMLLVRLPNPKKDSKVKLDPEVAARIAAQKAEENQKTFKSETVVVKCGENSEFQPGDMIGFKPNAGGSVMGRTINGVNYGIIEEYAIAIAYRPTDEEIQEEFANKLAGASTPAEA